MSVVRVRSCRDDRSKRTELGDLSVGRLRHQFDLLVVVLLLSKHFFVLQRLEEPVGLKDPAALRKRTQEQVSSLAFGLSALSVRGRRGRRRCCSLHCQGHLPSCSPRWQP